MENAIEAPLRVNPENIGLLAGADKYVAVDVASGQVLLSQNANARQPVASITKIMTALVILDQKTDWQKAIEYTVADETSGAFAHIYRGEKVLFRDAWKTALIASDNNSIMAMIRSLGLSREEFVALMNRKAVELGLYNTNFDDPTGLSTQNLSTALDVAKLLDAVLKKNEIKETLLQRQHSFQVLNNKRTRKVNNTDILLSSFLNSAQYGYEFLGGKTGYLDEAGYCLASSIKKDGHAIIVVVLNSPTIEDRFQDVKVIADWVYENYRWK
jgi:D-alanyl-D-alanine carboxypeptidase